MDKCAQQNRFLSNSVAQSVYKLNECMHGVESLTHLLLLLIIQYIKF